MKEKITLSIFEGLFKPTYSSLISPLCLFPVCPSVCSPLFLFSHFKDWNRVKAKRNVFIGTARKENISPFSCCKNGTSCSVFERSSGSVTLALFSPRFAGAVTLLLRLRQSSLIQGPALLEASRPWGRRKLESVYSVWCSTHALMPGCIEHGLGLNAKCTTAASLT